MCGDSHNLKIMTDFEVEIELTELGFKEQPRVVEYVFAYIKML